MLERGFITTAEVIAEEELIHLSHARAGNWIDSRHHGAEVLVRPGAHAERRDIAGILGDVVVHCRSKPAIVRRLSLKVTGSPNAVWKMFWPLMIGRGRAAG